jgi:hypothetical protein
MFQGQLKDSHSTSRQVNSNRAGLNNSSSNMRSNNNRLSKHSSRDIQLYLSKVECTQINWVLMYMPMGHTSRVRMVRALILLRQLARPHNTTWLKQDTDPMAQHRNHSSNSNMQAIHKELDTLKMPKDSQLVRILPRPDILAFLNDMHPGMLTARLNLEQQQCHPITSSKATARHLQLTSKSQAKVNNLDTYKDSILLAPDNHLLRSELAARVRLQGRRLIM